MEAFLLARSTGELSQTSFERVTTTGLVRSFAPAPQHRFSGEGTESEDEGTNNSIWAHRTGVSALALEKFDGRL